MKASRWNDVAISNDDRRVLAAREQAVWLASLHASPHGVRRMSRQVSGVVETSNNLGMVALDSSGGSCAFMIRSLVESGSAALADEPPLIRSSALRGSDQPAGVRKIRCSPDANTNVPWVSQYESDARSSCRSVGPMTTYDTP